VLSRPRGLRATFGVVLALFGCHSHEPASDAAPPSSDARSTQARIPAPPLASASSRASASAAPSAAPVPVGCRVIGVKAKGPAPAGTPTIGTKLTGRSWFELADGVELALKHGETLRELSVVGPGRFLVCPDGDESVFVARGSVTTTPGPGSRAGALVTLATPFGVVEYPDAELRLEVNENGIVLGVKQGSATLVANSKSDVSAAPKTLRAPSGHAELHGKVDPDALRRRCEEARASVASGAAVPAPSAASERGRWAVTRLEARRFARQACASAHAAIGRLAEPERTLAEDQLLGRKTPAVPATNANVGAESSAGK
jgi:hypothetical protein